jgi:antitoxin ParD1/3/4
MPRSYALGAHFENLIDELVKGGRYNNASEVVRDGLRLLEGREKLRQFKVEEIRRSIEASRRSGVLLSEEEVFDPLDADLAKAEKAGQPAGK